MMAMHEEKDKKKEKGRQWRIVRTVVSLIVLVALICGAAFLIANRDSLRGESLASLFNRWFGRESGVGSELEFDVYADNLFASLGDGAAIVSNSSIQVVSGSGERIARETCSLESPTLASAGDWALAWDLGGTTAVQIRQNGTCTQTTAAGTIISASICENGSYCIASEATGYRGAVSVYTAENALCFQWFSGENYLLDADIAPAGNRFAALTLGESGSRVSVFSVDDAVEKGSYFVQDELFFDVEYLSDNRICLLSDQRMLILNGDGEEVASYDFAGTYIRDYQLDGNGYAVLLLCTYSTGSTGRLVTVGADGQEGASLDVTEDVLSLSANGRYVTAVFPEQTVLYDSAFDVRGAYAEPGVRSAVTRSDGSAILITDAGAFVYNP